MLLNQRSTHQGAGGLERAGQDRWTQSEREGDLDLQYLKSKSPLN